MEITKPIWVDTFTKKEFVLMLTTFLLIIIFAGVALSAWRFLDHRTNREAMHRLMSMQPVPPVCFDPWMIADLPESARPRCCV